MVSCAAAAEQNAPSSSAANRFLNMGWLLL
jgi:hypothetical protein